MGNKTSVSNLARRLGLKWPITRRSEDAGPCQEVQRLYEGDLIPILAKYFDLDNAGLRASEDLRGEVDDLLERYGPLVWSTEEHQDWLFDTSDARTEGLYKRQLVYDDPQDCQLIRDTYHEIAIQKAIRKRNERNSISAMQSSHYSPEASFANSSSEAGPRESLASVSGGAPREKKPVGHVESPLSFRSRDGPDARSTQDDSAARPQPVCEHLDVRRLQQLGVWIGDASDDDAAVTHDLSWNTLRHQWDAWTNAYTREDIHRGLQTLALHTERDKSVKCAECAYRGQGYGTVLKIRAMEFLPAREHAHVRTWRRMVWSLPCEDASRRLFAIIRCEKQRPGGAPVYSFWKTKGGYTQDVGVVTVRDVTGGDQSSGSGARGTPHSLGKRRRSEPRDGDLRSDAHYGAEGFLDHHIDHDIFLGAVANDEDRESSYRPSPPSSKFARRDASGRFSSIRTPSPGTRAEDLSRSMGHQRDSIPVSRQHGRPYQRGNEDRQDPELSDPQPQRKRSEEQSMPSSSAHQPTARRPTVPQPAAPPPNSALPVRVFLQLKGDALTCGMSLEGIETIKEFFARIADAGPFQQSIAEPARIKSVIVSDRAGTFKRYLDADSDFGEDMLEDVRELVQAAGDGKVKLRAEIELREQW